MEKELNQRIIFKLKSTPRDIYAFRSSMVQKIRALPYDFLRHVLKGIAVINRDTKVQLSVKSISSLPRIDQPIDLVATAAK